jgi:hypothetical protein
MQCRKGRIFLRYGMQYSMKAELKQLTILATYVSQQHSSKNGCIFRIANNRVHVRRSFATALDAVYFMAYKYRHLKYPAFETQEQVLLAQNEHLSSEVDVACRLSVRSSC